MLENASYAWRRGSSSVALTSVTVAIALAGLGACSDEDASRPRVRSAQSAIIAGRPSPASENYAVLIRSAGASCSGTLVAPNVVITARHCLLLNPPDSLDCTPEGEIADPSNPVGQDTRLDAPGAFTVSFGERYELLKDTKVRVVFAASAVGICKNDVAAIVLDADLADVWMPIRSTVVRVGEEISVAGWGRTGDTTSILPESRTARDGVRVELVGPGAIPPGAFAVAGATLCQGDSGSGAIIRGAIAGVYTMLEGGACESAQGRNVLAMVAPHKSLIDEAFASAGRTPWWEGQPAPWLLPNGSACTSDAACVGGRCDPQSRTCATLCAPGSVETDASASACGASASCDELRKVCVPAIGPTRDATPKSGSCAAAPAEKVPRRAALTLLGAVIVVLRARSRRGA